MLFLNSHKKFHLFQIFFVYSFYPFSFKILCLDPQLYFIYIYKYLSFRKERKSQIQRRIREKIIDWSYSSIQKCQSWLRCFRLLYFFLH
jgi:hypothetical protein